MIDGSPHDTVTRRRRRLITLIVTALTTLIALSGVITTLVLASQNGGLAARSGQRPAVTGPLATGDQDPLPAQPMQRPLGQPPGTIQLPRGGVATLIRRELDRSGTLPIPKGVDQATWWGAGLDSPTGATVLAGHVNWHGQTGPFAELWQAVPAEAVSVSDHAGRVWRYRITQAITIDKQSLPQRANDLFSQGGRHRLVLVTCGGRFVGGDTGYDENRIVIAEPETPPQR